MGAPGRTLEQAYGQGDTCLLSLMNPLKNLTGSLVQGENGTVAAANTRSQNHCRSSRAASIAIITIMRHATEAIKYQERTWRKIISLCLMSMVAGIGGALSMCVEVGLYAVSCSSMSWLSGIVTGCDERNYLGLVNAVDCLLPTTFFAEFSRPGAWLWTG